MVRALLANSKVPGSNRGGVTDDFSFFRIWLASVEFGREKSSTRHVASNFLTFGTGLNLALQIVLFITVRVDLIFFVLH